MAEPKFDRTNGFWYVRYRTGKGTRAKKLLDKDPRWSKGAGWPPTSKQPKCPPDILIMARPFQDLELMARKGQEVKGPRQTNLKTFLGSYRASYVLSKKATSVRSLDYAIENFLPFCEKAKVVSVEQVTKAHCREFLEDQLRGGKARNSIKGFKGMLGGAFRRAVENELIATSPWDKLPVPGIDDESSTPSWSMEEITALKATLKGWHWDMFVVGINCGFRQEALCNLEWRDVRERIPRRRFGDLTCRKEFSKSGNAYSVPLVRPLQEVFRRRRAESSESNPTGKIFPGRKPGTGITNTTFRDAIERACAKAGIEYRGHAWHSMRTTFATLCHMRGVNPRSIQEWMNHSSIQMTDKYSHYSSESDDAEAEKMEDGDDVP